MASPRKYLASLRDGRIILTKSDGGDFSQEDLDWVKSTLTTQLRTDNVIAAKGGLENAALLEPDVESGVNRKTGETIRIHPLLHHLKYLIGRRGWKLAALGPLIGKRESALSEWFRGLLQPTLRDVAAAYGLLGYRLVPVPIVVEADARVIARQAEDNLVTPIIEQDGFDSPAK